MLRYLKAMPWLIFIIYTSVYSCKKRNFVVVPSATNHIVPSAHMSSRANTANRTGALPADTSVERKK